MRELKRIGTAAAFIVIAAVVYRWGPETRFFVAHRQFTLFFFAAVLALALAALASVDYQELSLRIRWKMLFPRHAGGPYPFPEKGPARTFAIPWLHDLLLQFNEWKRDADARFCEAYHHLDITSRSTHQEAEAYEAVRVGFESARRAAQDAERSERRYIAWLRDAEVLPPGFIDADSFREARSAAREAA